MEPENKKRLEELVEAISGFINSPVHTIYMGATKRQHEEVESNILELDPLSPELARQFAYLHGQRLVLSSNLTLFEDAVSNLKARIQDILDAENPISHSNNADDNEPEPEI